MITYIAVSAIVLGISFETIRIVRRSMYAKYGAKKTKPFISEKDTYTKTILLVGDSIAYGVGASAPQFSLAGTIEKEYPAHKVHVRAQPGSGTSSLLQFLKEAEQVQKTYNTIIMFSGGMDIIKGLNGDAYKNNLEHAFKKAKQMSPHVIYISPPNVGLAPIFKFPFRYIFSRRAKHFTHVAEVATNNYSITHINLFRTKHEDHLKQDKNLYAKDLSHPNDKGYALWFKYFKIIFDTRLT